MMISVSNIGLEVLSASDRVAERVEWLQVTLSQGPAVDARARSVPISVPDLNKANGRWPIFLSEVADSGIGGMYAPPLQIGAIKVGVLVLYRTAEAPLGGAEFADAVAISELVTAVLLDIDRNGRPLQEVAEDSKTAPILGKDDTATGATPPIRCVRL